MSVLWRNIFLIITLAKIEIEADTKEFGNELIHFMQQVYNERAYDGIFLQRRYAADCIDENLQEKFELPVLSLGANKTIYLKGTYSSEMLAVMCTNHIADKELLELLAVNLQHMRSSRIVALINEDFGEGSNKAKLIDFFQLGQKLKMLNVIVIHRNFWFTQLYHSYTQFPDFQLETHKLAPEALLFPDRLNNLFGKVLLTLPDQIEPRSMLYTDAKGRQRMSGYLGKILHAFESHHNATLRLPYPFNKSNNHVLYLEEISSAAFNESIDIGTCACSPQRELKAYAYTYAFEITQWLVMVPIERGRPLDILLTSFLKIDFVITLSLQCFLLSGLLTLEVSITNGRCGRVSPLDVLCNDSTMRGMLGQSFQMRPRPTAGIKLIYVLLLIGGLVLSTSFSTYLIKLFTAPPMLTPISNFDEAMRRHLKICVSEQEVPTIIYYRGSHFWEKYKSMFAIIKTYDEFQLQRRKMVLPFGYPITTSLWPIIAEQQKYFARNTYYLSEELFLSNFLLMALPLNENSIYKEALDRVIHRVQDSGLLRSWIGMSFYDMVALKRISFQHLSNPSAFHALEVEDFYWIWIVYCAAMSCAIFEFFVEKFLLERCCQMIHCMK